MTAINKKMTAKIWHDKAMTLSQDALVRQLKGQSGFLDMYVEAFENEQKAAMLFLDMLDNEPTRSVLFRSAASLAIQCGKLNDAEQLIEIGLSGKPPKAIAAELIDLQSQITLQMNL